MILALLLKPKVSLVQKGGYRSSKCFSCEAQDNAMGLNRNYGSKCFSCERQDYKKYGNKCFSCEL